MGSFASFIILFAFIFSSLFPRCVQAMFINQSCKEMHNIFKRYGIAERIQCYIIRNKLINPGFIPENEWCLEVNNSPVFAPGFRTLYLCGCDDNGDQSLTLFDHFAINYPFINNRCEMTSFN